MEKEQIIKALECYQETMICAVVDENNRTHFITNADALALIKELTEEVESWKKECASRTTVYCELHSKCEKLTEENERLNDELKKRPKKLVITKLNTEDENK